MAPFNDYEAAWLASAVYYGGDEETFKKEVPEGWKKEKCSENAETGFVCMLFTKVYLQHPTKNALKVNSVNRMPSLALAILLHAKCNG